MTLLDRAAAFTRAGDVDQADRLRLRAAARPCDAGDRDADLGAGMRQAAFGHGARHLFADRADALDQGGGHAKHLGLGLVGVDDEAALDHV